MQVFPSKPHHISLFTLTQKYCPNQLVRLFLVSTEKSLFLPDRQQALNSSSIFPYVKLFMLCVSTFLAAISFIVKRPALVLEFIFGSLKKGLFRLFVVYFVLQIFEPVLA